ncbi:MAG: HNH endonuclease, partial [Chthonomonadaceae bacterium]|nr:HNH endonuclease [Chthonomonadaceae bacterium]
VTQGFNSELSNKSFTLKKQMLSEHGLRINSQYFGEEIKVWDEDAIIGRSHNLIEQILALYPDRSSDEQESLLTGSPLKSYLLYHTKVTGKVAGHSVSKWKDALHAVIREAHKAGLDIEAIRLLSVPTIVEGDFFERGYKPVAETNLSIQGQAAPETWEIVKTIAYKLGLGVELIVTWHTTERVLPSLRGQTYALSCQSSH